MTGAAAPRIRVYQPVRRYAAANRPTSDCDPTSRSRFAAIVRLVGRRGRFSRSVARLAACGCGKLKGSAFPASMLDGFLVMVGGAADVALTAVPAMATVGLLFCVAVAGLGARSLAGARSVRLYCRPFELGSQTWHRQSHLAARHPLIAFRPAERQDDRDGNAPPDQRSGPCRNRSDPDEHYRRLRRLSRLAAAVDRADVYPGRIWKAINADRYFVTAAGSPESPWWYLPSEKAAAWTASSPPSPRPSPSLLSVTACSG